MAASKAFGDILFRLRDKRGLSQSALAQAADTSIPYIGQLEAGKKKKPSLEIVERLCQALKLSAKERDDLYRAAGHQTQPRERAVDLEAAAQEKQLSDELALSAAKI